MKQGTIFNPNMWWSLHMLIEFWDSLCVSNKVYREKEMKSVIARPDPIMQDC